MININVESNNRFPRIGDIIEYEFYDDVVMTREYVTFAMIIYDILSDMPYRILDITDGRVINGYQKIEDMSGDIVKIYDGSYDLTIK